MDDILKYAVENGIIDLSYVQEKIEMNKRKELLEKHKYDIWVGKDGRYYTYIPDEEKGRILKSRKTKKEIEDVIVEYWEKELYNPTVKDIYEEWICGKLKRDDITITTKNRYDRQYNESMKEFGNRRIKSVDEYDIEEFALNAIHQHKMTAKGFCNLRTIIFGIFKLAKKKKLVSFSISEVMSDIEISKKTFRKVRKKDDELIFMEDDINKIKSYFTTCKMDMKDLGILLLFNTGMRPGELSGLRWSDVNQNIISIQRTEIRYEDENGKYVYVVRDFPKTEAGIRDIIIPKQAMWIIQALKRKNPFGEYVFSENGIRIKSCQFDKRIRLICRKAMITEKSLNKIRKTYGTMLIDSNVDESLIISQMGHTDIATTKMYYYKNRRSIQQKAKIIDEVFENACIINEN